MGFTNDGGIWKRQYLLLNQDRIERNTEGHEQHWNASDAKRIHDSNHVGHQ